MIDMTNPFAAMGPAGPDPDEERRKALHAALMQSLAAPKAIDGDVAANEAKMKQNQLESTIAKAGQMIGSGMLGVKSNGENLATDNYDADSKDLLAKNLEMKKTQDETTKRRADIAKAFGLQDVQDAGQLDRQNKNNASQIERDNNQNVHTVGRDDAKFKQEKDMAGINAGYANDLQELKNEGAVDAKGQKIGKPIESKYIDTLTGYDNSTGLMARAKGLLSVVQPGPGESLIQAAARKFGQDSPDFTEFKAVVGTNLAETIKVLSGTAANESEVKRLKENTPNETDNAESFNRKMKFLEEYTKEKRVNLMGNLKKAGRDVSGWETQAQASGSPQAVAPTTNTSGPQPGEVRQGYKFKGGEPHDKNNWEKVN